MGSSLVVSLLFAVGSGGWAYVQLARRTGGGNMQAVVIGTAFVGIAVFVFFFVTFKMVIHLS
ncbi:MAG TPA: hypothetical protein VFL85_05125 [Candidatus Saccharimonadales bacterium]|nr:hypothetical protein [Candidatus Saccharimonadales bacterium]